jgi:hypothetical protein
VGVGGDGGGGVLLPRLPTTTSMQGCSQPLAGTGAAWLCTPVDAGDVHKAGLHGLHVLLHVLLSACAAFCMCCFLHVLLSACAAFCMCCFLHVLLHVLR